MSQTETLTVLKGTDETKSQDFVLNTQNLATDKGFGHVSAIWYGKTISYDDGLKQIEAGRAMTEDITATPAEMVPTTKDGHMAFHHKPSDRYFEPTPHAIRQAGGWADAGTWYVESLLSPAVDYKNRVKYVRDDADADTLAHVLRNGLRRLDQSKKFLWRTRNDGSLRAMLTDRYAIVDNRWLIELLSRIVPGGRLSHWRGDSDTVYGNILIPDTIRAESDSDYGGMLSIGNSEIGERRVSSLPSIFRAICMNGCIWGQTVGKGIRQVHRGRIELPALALEIQTNLNAQIPLLPQGIEKLLGLRTMGWDGATDAKVMMAQTALEFKLSKKQATAVLTGWLVENKQTPDLSRTLFGITNAVTRAGQTFDNAAWVDFDTIGGKLLEYTPDDFSRFVSRAKGLSVKEVEDVFSNAV